MHVMFRPLLLLAATLAALAAAVTAGMAQTVAVTNGIGAQGFGWMFRHGGACYVALPRHVAGPTPRLTVTSAAPVTVGSATAILPFWDGVDLALAVLRGGIEPRCTETLDRMEPSRRARAAASARLHRLSPTGEEERVALRITRRDYLTLEAEVSDAGQSVYQGTSGAFAFAGDEPIGMAITSDDPVRLRLMRTEEIAMNLRRYLDEQGAAFVADARTAPEARPDGIPLDVISASVAPVAPDLGPENVVGPGDYVFRAQRGAEIVLKIRGGNAVAVRRLTITTEPDPDRTLPKSVLILSDAGESGTRLREWTRGTVAPDGTFDTGTKAPRNVRWLKIVVLSTWAGGSAAIGDVTAY